MSPSVKTSRCSTTGILSLKRALPHTHTAQPAAAVMADMIHILVLSLIRIFVAERSSADVHHKAAPAPAAGQDVRDVRRRSQHVNRLQITHV